MRSGTILLLVISLCSGCTVDQQFVEQSMDKFNDQAFKDVVALVELYKLRNGRYPNSLNELEFAGAWDMVHHASVSYERLDSFHYSVMIDGKLPEKGKYPKSFYRGLGLTESE